MSAAALGPAQARGVVEAGLDRAPQDMLEAAVVLESWLGVPAQRAVALGGAMMADTEHERRASAGRPHAVKERPRRAVYEALALVAAVAAIAGWAAPLGRALGPTQVERAIVVALPLTLALQWLLRTRWLGREDGVAHLAERPLVPAAAGDGRRRSRPRRRPRRGWPIRG